MEAKHETRNVVAVLFVLLMLGITSPANAELTVIPEFTTTIRFDNNYFRAEDDEREVYTYLIQPGLNVDFSGARTTLNLGYTLDAHYFDDQESFIPAGQRSADEDDYTGHTFNLFGSYRPFRRLTLGLAETYYETRDPGQSDELNNTVDRDQYFINVLSPSISYFFEPKFTLRLRYSNTLTDYDPSNAEDSNENRGIFTLAYHFNRTISLDLEYQYAEMDYNKDTSPFTANQFKLILTKAFRIIRVDAGVGYQSRDFDQDGLNDIDSTVFHVNLNTTPALLSGPHLTFNYDTNFNNRGIGEEYFLAHRFTVDLGYDFGRRLSAGIGGYYQISDYENEDRKDYTYDVALNAEYRIARWLTLSLSTGFENRDSSETGLDYDNTYFTGFLRFGYEFKPGGE